jgi:hypothetical protein
MHLSARRAEGCEVAELGCGHLAVFSRPTRFQGYTLPVCPDNSPRIDNPSVKRYRPALSFGQMIHPRQASIFYFGRFQSQGGEISFVSIS